MMYNQSYSANQVVQELMSRLKFISRVGKQEKINLKSFTFEANTLWGSFRRFFNAENRTGTLDFLRTTVLDSFELLIHTLGDESNHAGKQFAQHLLEDLVASKYGIMNLQNTYADDKFLVSHLQTLLQTIDVKIDYLLQNHNELRVVEDQTRLTHSPKLTSSPQATHSPESKKKSNNNAGA